MQGITRFNLFFKNVKKLFKLSIHDKLYTNNYKFS